MAFLMACCSRLASFVCVFALGPRHLGKDIWVSGSCWVRFSSLVAIAHSGSEPECVCQLGFPGRKWFCWSDGVTGWDGLEAMAEKTGRRTRGTKDLKSAPRA